MGDATCDVPGCGSVIACRGWCGKHYQRWLKHGDPNHYTRRGKTLEDWEREGGKPCNTCGERKPTAEFYSRKRAVDGLGPQCKLCRNAAVKAWHRANPEKSKAWQRANYYRRDRSHEAAKVRERNATPEGKELLRRQRLREACGITPEQYDGMVAAQNGLCAICQKPPRGGRTHHDQRLHVDHDHATGRIRGLLCRACNTAIGLLEEDVERLTAAARYIAAPLRADMPSTSPRPPRARQRSSRRSSTAIVA